MPDAEDHPPRRGSEAEPPAPPPPRDVTKVIPRRPRVTWWLGLVFACVFAALVTPSITADRWLAAAGIGDVELGKPAAVTVRVAPFRGHDTREAYVSGGGIIIARGAVADRSHVETARVVTEALPKGPLLYLAFFALMLVFGAIFTHHCRRSTRGRLVRVQIVGLAAMVLLAVAVKVMLLATATSILVVPVAFFAIVPTLVLDRVVGIATGVLAALVTGLLGPFDVGVSLILLVQAATAGLVVAERPKARWRAVATAGLVTTLLTAATYVLLAYLSTGHLVGIGDDPWHSPLLAAALGPVIATVIAVPLTPIYELLVGEITQRRLIELEDLSNPLLRQIAEKSPGTWQHSLMMANMAEIAANAIGASGRLVRVGAYYHDLGKSLQPKYFIENLEPGETSPHDQLPPEVSCDAIFAHVTEGIVHARKAGLHERVIDFMHMHHGNGVLEYFWGRTREQGNPRGLSIEQFRYPGHPPQSRETAILAICDAVEAASRTLKKPEPAAIDSLVQRIVYGKLHLGQLDESGLSMGDLRRVADSLRETIRHANHGRIEYPWQKASQDASATPASQPLTSTAPRLDSLDRPARAETKPAIGAPGAAAGERARSPASSDDALATTAGLEPVAERPTEVIVKRPAEVVAERPTEVIAERPTEVIAERPTEVVSEPAIEIIAEPAIEITAEPAIEITAEPAIEITADPAEPAEPAIDARVELRLPALPPGATAFAPDAPTEVLAPSALAAPPPPPAARKRAATLPPAPTLRAPTPPPVRRAPTSPPPRALELAPRAAGDRSAGPPPPVDLENAVTNPPPVRRSPSGHPATRLPALIVEAAPSSRDTPPGFDDATVTNPAMTLPGAAGPAWGTGLAARIDAALEADEWSHETPVMAPTAAELRALLGAPDPTRRQSLEELETLHRRAAEARERDSDPDFLVRPRRNPHTTEVDPEDIEAAIEVAPPARRPSAAAIAVAKPKKPE